MGLRSTTILHAERLQLGLTLNEYAICDSVYHLSNNPKAPVKGWCNQGRENMGKQFGFSRKTVINIVNKMIEKGLIERNEDGHIRTTDLWYNSVVIRGCVKSSHPTQNRGEESSQGGVKEVHSKPAFRCEESSHKIRIEEEEEEERGKDPVFDFPKFFIEQFGLERSTKQLDIMLQRIPFCDQAKIRKHLPGYIEKLKREKKTPSPDFYLKYEHWITTPVNSEAKTGKRYKQLN